MKFADWTSRLERTDWRDWQSAACTCESCLMELRKTPEEMDKLLEYCAQDTHLLSLCDHYDFFDKVVLYQDREDRFRLRLHRFLDESHGSRIHNHRWGYSSVVLRGRLTHRLYTVSGVTDPAVDPRPTMLLRHDLPEGSIYSLGDHAYHAVDAEAGTLTLAIRGPAIRGRFLIFDSLTGQHWWEYPRESETTEERTRKLMSPERHASVVGEARSVLCA